MNFSTLLALPFWLVLLLRFSIVPALRLSPLTLIAPKPIARQWRAVRMLNGRLLAVRVQVVLL
ncbi:hypothetical protein [Kouleothrix sp.]|uniref:hypothetical protein n=1 Tax=Kouleothrix sp. TaxID=2779161 RepID=UPI00391DA847